MAEVEKLATSTIAKDIPISSGGGSVSGIASGSVVSNDASASAEYGTSPTQERSSNSHPHDSEYDTASDLEGGEEYDESEEDDLEDDDDEEDDLTDEEDDDIDDEDAERTSGADVGGAGSQEKVSEAEIQKKVDEDRSNPQYIPKRGTFYEHDDRMADGDGEGVLIIGDPVGVDSGVTGTVGNAKASSQPPAISHASKTMKKWQPASGVERWSHDRFDESEQQPKSRSELISAYGYDIRTEDAPPRARRRRRYARGPTKYSRNWEDESAYIKINNKERKPPRASDFPALNERTTRTKQRREPREREENMRDEKENLPERRRAPMNKSSVNERLNIAAGRSNQNEEPRDREDIRARISGRPKIQGRQPAGSGRQAAMEFKPKMQNRNAKPSQQQSNNTHNNSRSDDRGYDRPQQRGGQYQTGNQNQNSSTNEQFQPKSSMKGPQSMSASNATHMKQNHQHHQQQQQQHYHGDNYSNSNNNNQATKFNEQHGGYSQQQQQQMQPGVQQHHSQPQQGLTQLRQPMPLKSTPPPSNLSQRLQQVQNRNDPSHVGSVQMHALATQNQQQQQQQQQLVMGQQQNANAMLISAVAQQQQQQQQLMQTPPQEQRGPPKRYSSMRRSQHDTGHLAEPHAHQQQQQMQQLHMQQPPPPPPQQATQAPPQQLIMQDQHSIIQANLLQQLYHQENLQAQMQALQVSQPPPAQQTKQPNYTTVPPGPTGPAAQPQAYGANPANTAYFVTDAYGAASNPQAPPQPAQYAPQQPSYLAPTPATAAALAYTNPPPPAQNALQAGPPTAVYAGPGGTGPAAPNSNQNYSNYQNYNTVGGTTYFVPPAPTTSRPVVLPQRRPTNAIPILPPAEKNKQRGNDTSKEDSSKSLSNSSNTAAPIGSAENIDHIIDNMFVQRPAFQPPQATSLSARQSSSPSNSDSVSSNVGADTQAQSSNNTDDSNAASNSLGANSTETNSTSSNPVVTDEVAPANNASSTENSSNNNPVTAQE